MTRSVHVSSSSKQDYRTPMEFVRLVESNFNLQFAVDAAASEENTKCHEFYDEEDNSLGIDWGVDFPFLVGHRHAVWLNPPFKRLDPWMAKCAEQAVNGVKIVSLTLAGTSQGWYLNHVLGNAMVLQLRERMIFEGETQPYPKDLMVCLWGMGMVGQGWWSWK